MQDLVLKETKNGYCLSGYVQCSACDGTGLYVGVCERDGAAVVCYRCKGTGRVYIEQHYTKFTARQKKKNVKRVFEHAGAYIISAEDVEVNGKNIPFSEYGVSYEEWLAGEAPKPLECLHCPFMHTQQMLDRNSTLYKTRCNTGLKFGSRISDCQFMPEKEKCWEIYKCEKT